MYGAARYTSVLVMAVTYHGSRYATVLVMASPEGASNESALGGGPSERL